jgi:fructokinase
MNQEIKEMLRSANACGAIITTKKGAIPALPTPDKVHKHKFLLLSTQ